MPTVDTNEISNDIHMFRIKLVLLNGPKLQSNSEWSPLSLLLRQNSEITEIRSIAKLSQLGTEPVSLPH